MNRLKKFFKELFRQINAVPKVKRLQEENEMLLARLTAVDRQVGDLNGDILRYKVANTRLKRENLSLEKKVVDELLNKPAEDEAESLEEALEIAQGEIVRLKTELVDMKGTRHEDVNAVRTATELSNRAQDKKLIMQGALYRAREVAGDMNEHILIANDAMAALPAPTNDEEDSAITALKQSFSQITRFSGMISNDGGGVEDLVITRGMRDEVEKRDPELLETKISKEIKNLKESLTNHVLEFDGLGVWEVMEIDAFPIKGEERYRLYSRVEGPGKSNYLDFRFETDLVNPFTVQDMIAVMIQDTLKEHAQDCVPNG